MQNMLETFTVRQIKTNGASIHVAKGGSGEPLLLLHGYPQTHVMWHRIAPRFAESFTVILADLRGYGDSSKPKEKPDHSNYSKRVMAQDMIEVMSQLGYESFYAIGHDRGARVLHRMLLDHGKRIKKAAILDMVPTYETYATTDKEFATALYHWFFLIQPADLPERLIAGQAEYFLHSTMKGLSRDISVFTPEAMAEYVRCFSDPATIHGICEDYRASVSIDLLHDEADLQQKVHCPLLVLWGANGFIGRHYDILAIWRKRAEIVQGYGIPSGHFLAEEAPEETYNALRLFFSQG
ncbi:fluoroacetate dehalogenase [Dictyobacter kobayashii]|uniref:Fluoroacetate dehalogenase n=2 Tax=Dictyobacter kobayashii TaxID=2014872 RepID=A0A402AKB3_9CHLR|nr:fluoroacetate dehalogenase [Dictyobacter kobayashii]